MSTNAVIVVEGLDVALYKHWDGDPDSTLPWLEKFNKEFTEKRGIDAEYKFAQLIRSSILMQEEFNLDPSTETGWGVFNNLDEIGYEYLYILMSDGTVTF